MKIVAKHYYGEVLNILLAACPWAEGKIAEKKNKITITLFDYIIEGEKHKSVFEFVPYEDGEFEFDQPSIWTACDLYDDYMEDVNSRLIIYRNRDLFDDFSKAKEFLFVHAFEEKTSFSDLPHTLLFISNGVEFSPYLHIKDEESGDTLILEINDEMLKKSKWGVSKMEILHAAIENTKRKYKPMIHVITGDGPEDEIELGINDMKKHSFEEYCGDDWPFFYLSNEDSWYGASVVLFKDVLPRVNQFMNGHGFYAVPDSMHGIYLFPKQIFDIDTVRFIVRCMDKSIPEDYDDYFDDIAFDEIYESDGKTLQLLPSDDSEPDTDGIFS